MSTNLPAVTSLPAHLAAFSGLAAQFLALNDAAASGVAGGQGHPRISIKGSRFRLNPVGGDELVINQMHLDVIIVGANPHMSKTYYANAYDPNAADVVAPTCFSDNGVGPSAAARSPQCGTCAACPHNVLGSKVGPAGGKLKACADRKKIAVLLGDVPNQVENGHEGSVYELRMPYMSAKNFTTYAQEFKNRGVPLNLVLTRMEFDSGSEFPRLKFSIGGWATAEQAASAGQVFGSDEVAEAVGTKDTARPAPAALPPMPPHVQQAMAPTPAPAQDPLAVAPALLAEAPKRTRGRPPAVAPTQGTVTAFPQTAAPAAAPGVLSPAQATVTAPTPAPAGLDALIAGAMA